MNLFNKKNIQAGINKRRRNETLLFLLFRGAAAINGIALFVILYFIVTRGWQAISWEFLTAMPYDSMTKGGILPCIVGTLSLGILSILISLPIGVASAIFLNE